MMESFGAQYGQPASRSSQNTPEPVDTTILNTLQYWLADMGVEYQPTYDRHDDGSINCCVGTPFLIGEGWGLNEVNAQISAAEFFKERCGVETLGLKGQPLDQKMVEKFQFQVLRCEGLFEDYKKQLARFEKKPKDETWKTNLGTWTCNLRVLNKGLVYGIGLTEEGASNRAAAHAMNAIQDIILAEDDVMLSKVLRNYGIQWPVGGSAPGAESILEHMGQNGSAQPSPRLDLFEKVSELVSKEYDNQEQRAERVKELLPLSKQIQDGQVADGVILNALPRIGCELLDQLQLACLEVDDSAVFTFVLVLLRAAIALPDASHAQNVALSIARLCEGVLFFFMEMMPLETQGQVTRLVRSMLQQRIAPYMARARFETVNFLGPQGERARTHLPKRPKFSYKEFAKARDIVQDFGVDMCPTKERYDYWEKVAKDSNSSIAKAFAPFEEKFNNGQKFEGKYYGSVVNGFATIDSDVDLVVKLGQPLVELLQARATGSDESQLERRLSGTFDLPDLAEVVAEPVATRPEATLTDDAALEPSDVDQGLEPSDIEPSVDFDPASKSSIDHSETSNPQDPTMVMTGADIDVVPAVANGSTPTAPVMPNTHADFLQSASGSITPLVEQSPAASPKSPAASPKKDSKSEIDSSVAHDDSKMTMGIESSIAQSDDPYPEDATDISESKEAEAAMIPETPHAQPDTAPPLERPTAFAILAVRLVSKELENDGWIVTRIEDARVPIVQAQKIFEGPNGDETTRCDISFEHEAVVHNSRLCFCYSELHPIVAPMAMLVKTWAKRRDINDPFKGSLSSYAYVLLVLYFLQSKNIIPNLQHIEGVTPEEKIVDTKHNVWYALCPSRF